MVSILTATAGDAVNNVIARYILHISAPTETHEEN